MYREVEAPNIGSTRRTRLLTEKEAATARADEELAFNTPTGADFGFKKIRGSPDWAKEILMTNATDIRTQNCQRCVVAHEARMRGYDVVARPSWGAGDTLLSADGWIKAFDFSYADIQLCNGETGDEVIKSAEKIMRSFGEGARAIVVFEWDKSAFKSAKGHTIVAQCKENDVVIFGDPQTGKRSAVKQLQLADYEKKVILLRVDNLPFTNVVKRCCKNRK